jgi:hypothetical protein
MSARTIAGAGSIHQNVTVEARQARLSLSPDSIVFRRSGIEFRSPTAFSSWTEMTLTLQSSRDGGSMRCSGVVISCTGNKHSGYHVAVVFTGLSKHAQEWLNTRAAALA